MKKDDLIDFLGRIDDDLIQDTDALRRSRKRPVWTGWAALAACFCLILGLAAAMPGMVPGKLPDLDVAPIPTETEPPVVTIHLEPLPVWTATYNDAAAMISANRAFIQGIFREELNAAELAAFKPDRWPDGMDFYGYAVFDNYGNLLDVILTAGPVTVFISDYRFGDCYLQDGEAAVSVCGDVEYRIYQYANGDQVTLGADAVIGGLYFDFCTETNPEELEGMKTEFQMVLEGFASYPDGKPDFSAIVPDAIPELMEQMYESLAQARTEPDFGRYLPAQLPSGFGESAIRRFRFDDSNYLSALWSRGLDDLSWVVMPYTEADAHRLTSLDEPENYDLSLYPIPRADSVPEELREIVEDPIFRAEELTLEAVWRRAYQVRDSGDTDGWRMRFSVRYGDVIVSISSKGVEPAWLYEQLAALISE